MADPLKVFDVELEDKTRLDKSERFDTEHLAPLASDPENPNSGKHPHDPEHINPKMSSDIAYWSHEFGVTGQILHEAIRMHGTSVVKVRAALAKHEVNLT